VSAAFVDAAFGGPEAGMDWSKSYHGLSVAPFPKEISDVLLQPIEPEDVEIKPGMYSDSSKG
jgi:hypothetical protein